MFDLFNDKHTLKSNAVFVQSMSESVAQDLPALDATIDRLMTGTGIVHHFVPMISTDCIPSTNNSRISAAAFVGHDFFARGQDGLGVESKDVDVGPATTLERSCEICNVTGVNAHCNLVAQTGAFKLVRMPAFAERDRLLNEEVNAIDGDKAALARISNQSVGPKDL